MSEPTRRVVAILVPVSREQIAAAAEEQMDMLREQFCGEVMPSEAVKHFNLLGEVINLTKAVMDEDVFVVYECDLDAVEE